MANNYEDFQIKPLTKGLGFHKKAIRLGETVQQAHLTQEKMKQSLPSIPPESFFLEDEPQKKSMGVESKSQGVSSSGRISESLDKLVQQLNLGETRKTHVNHLPPSTRHPHEIKKGEFNISATLPRYSESDIFSRNINSEFNRVGTSVDPNPHGGIFPSEQLSANSTATFPSRPVVTGTLPIHPRQVVKETVTEGPGLRRSGHSGAKGKLQFAPLSLSAAFLDFVMVVALSLIFLVMLLSVTKVEILSIAFNLQSDLATQVSLLVLFIAIIQMYVVVTRSFFGRTLGEWTFDYQLGNDQQQKSGWYPLLVTWRSLLMVLTGLVVLPILSVIVRRDLPAYFCGLHLYRRS